IIAVHGLGGDWEKIWTDDDEALWLQDFLPSQLPPASEDHVIRLQLQDRFQQRRHGHKR
ncbi:hypothetical protein BDD12DRAFT_767880, partial [Trichophaea hybrida]